MPANQKTIFISSFFGLVARNILATDFLRILSSNNNLRIVIIVPEKKVNFYAQWFGSDNVVVEGIGVKQLLWRDIFFNSLFLNLSDTQARRIHRFIELKKDAKYVRFLYHVFLAKFIGRVRMFRIFFRWLDFNLSNIDRFRHLFEKYNPIMVFSTDMFEPNDVDLVRGAEHRGIFTIGMVRSWDNVTTKGLNRIIPKKFIVSTPILMKELIKYNDANPNDIFIVGIPHYDKYTRSQRTDRKTLFEKLGLDPNKKTIFFAPPSSIYSGNEPIAEEIVKLFYEHNTQIIIRLYIVGSVNLGNIKPVPNKIAIDDPESSSDFTEADLTKGDDHLADLLYNSDVVIAFASTLAIDAIVFGRPVVFIDFDVTPKSYWESLRRFYDYDHQRAIFRTGGIRLAKNTRELVEFVGMYLSNPRIDEDGRRKVIEERCWKLDGQSSERLANVILKFL